MTATHNMSGTEGLYCVSRLKFPPCNADRYLVSVCYAAVTDAGMPYPEESLNKEGILEAE